MSMPSVHSVQCPSCQSRDDRRLPSDHPARQFVLAAADRDAEPPVDSAGYEPEDLEQWTAPELAWLRAQDDPVTAERRFCTLLEEARRDPKLFELLAAAATRSH